MADLTTRILADDKQFNDTINRDKRAIKDFDKGIDAAKSGLLKFAGGLGVAVGAASAFNSIMEGSQGTSDAFHNSLNACKGTVDLFFESLSRGDFSAFQDGILSTIDDLKELSALRDSLSDAKLAMNYNFMKSDPEFMKQETIMRDPSASKEEKQEAYKKAESIIAGLGGEIEGVVAGTREAILKDLNTRFKGRGLEFDMQDVDSFLSQGNNDFSSSQLRKDSEVYDKRYREFEREIAKAKQKEPKEKVATEASMAPNLLELFKGKKGENETQVSSAILERELEEFKKKNSFLEKQRLLRDDKDSNRATMYDDATYEYQLSQRKESMEKRLTRVKGSVFKPEKEAKAKAEKTPELTDLEKAQKQYAEGLKQSENLRANGILTQEEYEESVRQLIDKTLNFAGGLDASNEENQNFVEVLKQEKETFKKLPEAVVLPEKGKRDSTFDYKKTDYDKLSESLGLEKRYIAELEKIKNKTPELTEALNQAIANTNSLEDALKIEEVKKDIEGLSKELRGGTYEGIKNIAGATDRMTKGFESVKAVMEDVDASGWERLLSVFNAITQTIDGMMSIVDTINTIREVTENLTAAKEAQMIIEGTKIPAEIAGVEAVTAAKIAADVAEEASLTTKTATMVASNQIAKQSAVGLMAALSTTAYASIPFAGVGLATAQIASMQAIIAAASAIPAFEHGGIVGGSSFSGDKLLARVNSGEMILNNKQQSNLFNALEGGRGSSGASNVKFKIEGKDLVGVISQHAKLSSRI